jgi:hypothetical protein
MWAGIPLSNKYHAMFAAGHAPMPTDMPGTKWQVAMLSGPIPNMGGRPLRHRKVFEPRMPPYGCNVQLKDWRWGRFFARLDLGSDGQPVLALNFGEPKNGFLTQRICDHLRTTPDPNVMLGKFHIKWRGQLRFLSFFTLSRLPCPPCTKP